LKTIVGNYSKALYVAGFAINFLTGPFSAI